MISNCNEKTCPGWILGLVIGMLMYFTVIVNVFADVRVDIKRELPYETQHIVQTFEDKEDLEMWLGMKMDNEGCDPYVTQIIITLDNSPTI
jgi:hypothetical protein